MPDFDIQALDSLEPGDDKADKAFDRYRRSLVDLFCASGEGQALETRHGYAGFWAGCLLDLGFNHIGVALPNMTVSDLQEIVTGYFPRKVSLRSSGEAEEIIPELIAFWRFLGREFALKTADSALRYLAEIQNSFVGIMNDPSRFGTAKSLFMQGQAAGFDMSDQDQMNMFVAACNARVATDREDASAGAPTRPELPGDDPRANRNQARKLRRRITGISKKHPRRKRR